MDQPPDLVGWLYGTFTRPGILGWILVGYVILLQIADLLDNIRTVHGWVRAVMKWLPAPIKTFANRLSSVTPGAWRLLNVALLVVGFALVIYAGISGSRNVSRPTPQALNLRDEGHGSDNVIIRDITPSLRKFQIVLFASLSSRTTQAGIGLFGLAVVFLLVYRRRARAPVRVRAAPVPPPLSEMTSVPQGMAELKKALRAAYQDKSDSNFQTAQRRIEQLDDFLTVHNPACAPKVRRLLGLASKIRGNLRASDQSANDHDRERRQINADEAFEEFDRLLSEISDDLRKGDAGKEQRSERGIPAAIANEFERLLSAMYVSGLEAMRTPQEETKLGIADAALRECNSYYSSVESYFVADEMRHLIHECLRVYYEGYIENLRLAYIAHFNTPLMGGYAENAKRDWDEFRKRRDKVVEWLASARQQATTVAATAAATPQPPIEPYLQRRFRSAMERAQATIALHVRVPSSVLDEGGKLLAAGELVIVLDASTVTSEQIDQIYSSARELRRWATQYGNHFNPALRTQLENAWKTLLKLTAIAQEICDMRDRGESPQSKAREYYRVQGDYMKLRKEIDDEFYSLRRML
jgi:hypothetical protein